MDNRASFTRSSVFKRRIHARSGKIADCFQKWSVYPRNQQMGTIFCNEGFGTMRYAKSRLRWRQWLLAFRIAMIADGRSDFSWRSNSQA